MRCVVTGKAEAGRRVTPGQRKSGQGLRRELAAILLPPEPGLRARRRDPLRVANF